LGCESNSRDLAVSSVAPGPLIQETRDEIRQVYSAKYMEYRTHKDDRSVLVALMMEAVNTFETSAYVYTLCEAI
jgi:hypothetical protein